jgi:DNA processing protein
MVPSQAQSPDPQREGDSEGQALHWLALKLSPGLGTRLAARLAGVFGDPRAVFQASPSDLEQHGVPPLVARMLSSSPAYEEAQRELERSRKFGCEIVVYSDARYPEILRQIFDPPVLLYCRGNLELLSAPAIAMVGARKPTPYGLAVAERLAADLASRGLVIVSGLARGIDTAAHKGAVEQGGGRTIGVLGCGIDQCYPSENKRLKAQMEEVGLVVSEFPIGSFAAPQNFPIRNRLISGLSLGVLVVEAAQYSGSLITARLALEQNRDVFCVPGNITNKFSWGPNTLIKQGSKVVMEWRDVMDELPAPVRQALMVRMAEGDATGGVAGASEFTEGLSGVEKALCEVLKVEESLQIDLILDKIPEHSPSEVLAGLLELEIKGMARQLPGKNYVKALTRN